MNLVFIPQPVGCAALKDRVRPRWALIAAYAGASAAGGACLGFSLTFFGLIVGGASTIALWTIAAVLAVTGLAAEAFGFAARLPQRSRQVPREWLSRRSGVDYALRYGAMLGGGFLTYLVVGSMYTLAAILLVAPSSTGGAALGAIYGFTRAAPLVVDAARDSRGDGLTLVDSLGLAARWATVAAGLAAFASWVVESGTI